MHWRSDFVAPIPVCSASRTASYAASYLPSQRNPASKACQVWSVPRSFLPAYIGPVAHNIYNTLVEAAWVEH